MSITITIANDNDQSIERSHPCSCTDFSRNGKPVTTCGMCKGTGIETYKLSKYELTLSSANFVTLWNALSFCGGDYGDMNPNKILAAIQGFRPELAIRATERISNFYNCGIDIDYVKDRIQKIKEIATEAAKREEQVCWS
jgi:hypothetical protein